MAWEPIYFFLQAHPIYTIYNLLYTIYLQTLQNAVS